MRKNIDVKYLPLLIIICFTFFIVFFVVGIIKFNQMPKSFNWTNDELRNVPQNYDYDIFTDKDFEQYKINDYIITTDINRRDTEKDKYSFYVSLSVFAKDSSKGEVIVNHVNVSEKRDIYFQEADKDINQIVEFTPAKMYDLGTMILVDELNGGHINAQMHSKILVTVNITVNENGQSITKDLAYTFSNNLKNSTRKSFKI